jgi:tetratricopeptide (TPR) repeat protein
MFIVNSSRIRLLSLNRTTSAYLLAAESFSKISAATISCKIFPKRCNFFDASSVYSSVCRFPPPSHLPPRGNPRGFFLLLAANVKEMSGLLLTLLFVTGNALYQDPSADRLIRTAVDSTYHLRLNDARSAAGELEQRYPDHPAGFLIQAETYWWEAQADPDNREVEAAYYHAQQLAQDKAEAAVKAGKYSQPEVLAYLASAHGSYARFQVTQKGSYYRAMRAGLRAHKYAEQVYALDKNYYDIYVGLGAFNYFAGTLPSVIKPFAWLFGAHGDKDVGVEQLQTAMQKARYSRTEGRIVYYTALLANKEYAAAFPLLEQLIADYPDNFVLYGWATEWFREQNKNLEGTDYFERMFAKQVKRSEPMAKSALLEKATLQIAHNRKSDAIQTLQRIKAIPGSDPLISKKVQTLEKDARRL